MSATNRGGERVPYDDYPTPHYCTHRLFEAIPLPRQLPHRKVRYLEAAAGRGDVIVASTIALDPANVEWTAVEIRPDCDALLRQVADCVLIGDFFGLVARGLVDVAEHDVHLGNPPYSEEELRVSLRQRFIELLVERSRPDAWVAQLLPLGHLGTVARGLWLRQHEPDLYILPDRPPFRFNGTDAEVYAWHVWPPGGHARSTGIHRHLEPTPRWHRQGGRLFTTSPTDEETP